MFRVMATARDIHAGHVISRESMSVLFMSPLGTSGEWKCATLGYGAPSRLAEVFIRRLCKDANRPHAKGSGGKKLEPCVMRCARQSTWGFLLGLRM